MYPLHYRDHLFLLEHSTRTRLKNRHRRRLAVAQQQARLDEDRLARAWAELTSALDAMKCSREELESAGTTIDT